MDRRYAQVDNPTAVGAQDLYVKVLELHHFSGRWYTAKLLDNQAGSRRAILDLNLDTDDLLQAIKRGLPGNPVAACIFFPDILFMRREDFLEAAFL